MILLKSSAASTSTYGTFVLIDSRTYPARSVEEPEKDRTLRGSKDGFVETIVFNTALIRRRIRDTHLRMEMMNAGNTSKTDIVVCYMEDRVDKAFLEEIKTKIQNICAAAVSGRSVYLILGNGLYHLYGYKHSARLC